VVRPARSPAGARSDRRVTLGISALYALIAYATMFPTWPSRLRTRILGVGGDHLLNLWILHWAGHHAFGGWARLWNAPIFWPNRNSLAYSDAMLPIAILHRALAVVLRSDILAFNLIYLAAAFGSMLGAYLLARLLARGSRAASRVPSSRDSSMRSRHRGSFSTSISSSRSVASSPSSSC
jgi:hypothetical protein